MPDPWDSSWENVLYYASDEAIAIREAHLKVQGRRLFYVLAYFFLFVLQAIVLDARRGAYVVVPALLALLLVSGPQTKSLMTWLDAPEAR